MQPIASEYRRLIWRKASYSQVSDCVEVASVNGNVAVRDSKNPDGPILMYTAAGWRAFINSAKSGELDGIR